MTEATSARRPWFYVDALGRQQGPVSATQLAHTLALRDHYVWREGMERWVMGSEWFARDDVEPLPALTETDAHAQPVSRALCAARRADRDIHELTGLVRGVLLDGEVSDAEAVGLYRWLQAHPDVLQVWPASAIALRLQRIFADGRVDEEERADLTSILNSALGAGPGDRPAAAGEALSSRLPLDDPEPAVEFDDRVFVLTGKFVYGARKDCERAVLDRGGRCAVDVSRETDVVVIGTLGSADWAHSTHGRKIEKAVVLRAGGRPVRIVSERHWSAHL